MTAHQQTPSQSASRSAPAVHAARSMADEGSRVPNRALVPTILSQGDAFSESADSAHDVVKSAGSDSGAVDRVDTDAASAASPVLHARDSSNSGSSSVPEVRRPIRLHEPQHDEHLDELQDDSDDHDKTSDGTDGRRKVPSRHQRNVSSASAADMGTSGMVKVELRHPLQPLSAGLAPPEFRESALAPMAFAPQAGLRYGSSTDERQEHEEQEGWRHDRHSSLGMYSIGEASSNGGDIGGRFQQDEYYDSIFADDRDNEDLLRADPDDKDIVRGVSSVGLPASREHFGSSNARQFYDSPARPDFDDIPLEDRRGPAAHDIENNAPWSPLRTKTARPKPSMSRRARGTQAFYTRTSGSGDFPGDTNSGVSRRKSVVDRAKNELRRISIRVVNLKNRPETRHAQLGDEDVDDDEAAKGEAGLAAPSAGRTDSREDDVDGPFEQDITGWSVGDGVLRGRTLGVFGPKSKLRQAAFQLFLWP